jgi:23S rRNA pseudouridine1911/1915/1917 synthase
MPQHSRSKLAAWIEAGHVLVEDEAETKPALKLKPGWTIEVDELQESEIHDLTPAEIPLNVVFEDEAMLIVDKPRGLAAHPAASLKEPSLVNALLARGGDLSQAAGAFRPGIVHRLDKDTTGLMVVAKTDAAHVALAKQFETKTAERRYVGIIAGEPKEQRFDINAPIARDRQDRQKMAVDPQGKPALTHCKVLSKLPAGTLMAFKLSTGRTHQIRVHLRAIGHPILGDAIYATREYQNGALQLHAAFLAVDHPKTGKRIIAFASPPEDFLGKDSVERHHLEEF